MKSCKDYTTELLSFLVNDTILPSYNPLTLKKKHITKSFSLRKSKHLIRK